MQAAKGDDELDVAALEHADKKLRRRRYKRDRMREYTRVRQHEKQRLVDECTSLEHELLALQQLHTTPLTWKQIATALRYAHDSEVAKSGALRLQVLKNSTLLRHLQTWVTLNSPPEVPLNPSVSTWQDVTLSSHPTTRLLGQRWITQRMLCHMDPILQAHNVPSCITDAMDDLAFDFDDNGHYITILRSVFHLPLAAIAPPTSDAIFAACHRHITAYMVLPRDPANTVETNGHTHMLRVVTSYGEAINLVVGRFHPTRTRWVVVAQQIQSDDAIDQSRWPQKCRSVWYDIQLCDADAVLHWRMLQILPQAKTGSGIVSMEDEGRRWGVDMAAIDNGVAAFMQRSHQVMVQVASDAFAEVQAGLVIS